MKTITDNYTHTVSLKITHDSSNIKEWCSRTGIPYIASLDYSRDMVPDVLYHFAREQDATLFALRWCGNLVDTTAL